MKHYSNFGTFKIASLVDIPGHYLRKYGTLFQLSSDQPGTNQMYVAKQKST